MPQFATKHFGIIEFEDDVEFEFPGGLPGFDEEKRFLPIEQPGTSPIVFLQSLTRPELCFMTLPVPVIEPGYRLAVAPEDLRILNLPGDRQPEIGSGVLCLAIISVAEDRPPTANLLAPIVVNLKTRQAVQAIQVESGYSHQHPLVAASGEDACS